MKKIFILLFTILSISVSAQKAYKIMSKDIFEGMDSRQQTELEESFNKAVSQFKKVLSKNSDDVMATFGLYVVYSYDKYSKKDYFKAWKYFDKAYKNMDNFTENDITILNEYFFKVDKKRRNRPLKKNMDWEKQIIEDKLIKFVREENNIEYAKQFIKEFPNSKYYGNVVHIRNYIEYRLAEDANSVQALNDFVKKYPDAAQVNLAIEKRNTLAYKQAVAKNSLSALKDFVKKYPKAAEIEEAKKLMGVLAYEEAAKSRDLQILEQYMREYPNSSKMPEAKKLKKQLLFEWAKSVNTIDAYNKFVSLYPEGELYIDIFNLKANSLGQEILMDFPMDNYQFIKCFDNKSMPDYGGDIALRVNGNLLVVANTKPADSLMYDAWLLNLDKDGKMLNNHIIGNKYDDKINKIIVSPADELYAVGVTNAIIDSIPGKAWIFRINSKGENLYNAKLEATEATGVAVYFDGRALVSGYQINSDSLFEPVLTKISNNGKKLWSRTYSQGYQIYDIAIDNTNIGYAAGGSWYFAVDKNGYLKWNKIIETDTKITAVNILPNGNIVFAGTRLQQGYAVCVDKTGKQIWQTTFNNQMMTKVKTVTSMDDNSVLCSGDATDNKVVTVKINANGTANPAKVFTYSGGLQLNGVVNAKNNNAVISLTRLNPQKDIVVFKLAF
jgi:hypothetical protein